MSMLSKILFLICLVYPTNAHAGAGRFTLVPKGAPVPFEATCFDTEATAKLLTWKEFLKEEERKQCDFEKRTLSLDYDLVIENIQITLDETRTRYQIETDTRDKELEELRDIIKKNKKLNIPVVVATSVAVGFGIGFSTYHFASN